MMSNVSLGSYTFADTLTLRWCYWYEYYRISDRHPVSKTILCTRTERNETPTHWWRHVVLSRYNNCFKSCIGQPMSASPAIVNSMAILFISRETSLTVVGTKFPAIVVHTRHNVLGLPIIMHNHDKARRKNLYDVEQPQCTSYQTITEQQHFQIVHPSCSPYTRCYLP